MSGINPQIDYVGEHEFCISHKYVHSGQLRIYYAYTCACGAMGSWRVIRARAMKDAQEHVSLALSVLPKGGS